MFRFLGAAEFVTLSAGRKASALHELLRAGFEVPRGFVIPFEADLAALDDAALAAAIEKIGGFPVAVRSSGALEDLEGSSFAGQYVTFLEVSGLEAMREKIRLCRESAASPQVLAYLAKNKLSAKDAKVNVLVQRMVSAHAAGVAFTIHPLTGNEEHVLAEACLGLGEKLVSGQISPTRCVLRIEDGAIVEQTPGDDGFALSAGAARDLAAASLAIQAHFGRPQDIEWALDAKGKLWILQSRPITSIQWRTDLEEYTNADFKDGGVSARVCTPLMYSLYRDAMQNSMPRYLSDIRLIPRESRETWIGIFYGRPYWNASATKRALHKVPGFDEEAFDRDLGIRKSYGEKGPVKIPFTPVTIARAVPVLLALEKHFKSHLELTAAYGKPFLEAEALHLTAIGRFASATDAEIFDKLEEAVAWHLRTESDYFNTIYNNSNAQSDFKSLLEKIGKATGRAPSVVALMSGLTDVSHMTIQRDILKLYAVARAGGLEGASWDAALRDFLALNYFHGDSELDLSVPRWGENPARVRELVEAMIKTGTTPASPEESANAQAEVFRQEERDVLESLRASFGARLRFESAFKKQIQRSRIYLHRREQMREYSTRCYHVARRVVLEAGKRLATLGFLDGADEVLMLHSGEVIAAARGKLAKDESLRLSRFRRAMYRGYRELTPPDELGGSVEQRGAEAHVEMKDGHVTLKGIGCSPGTIEGIVRVLESLDHAGELRKGEILVTKFTDPGWTPVLGLVSGIVTEVGGLLSHAAVIGREYGIPAVLNIHGVMKVLKTGQRVRVDGRSGIVEVLE